MDLFGPSRTKSLGGNYYGLVIVDDYSRFTWTLFIATKDNAYLAFKKFVKVCKMKKGVGFLQLNQIMGANFKMRDLINYVKSMESSITFLHLELHNRME